MYADDTNLYIKFDVTAERDRRSSLLIFEQCLQFLDNEIVLQILLFTFPSQHAPQLGIMPTCMIMRALRSANNINRIVIYVSYCHIFMCLRYVCTQVLVHRFRKCILISRFYNIFDVFVKCPICFIASSFTLYRTRDQKCIKCVSGQTIIRRNPLYLMCF